MDPAVHYLSYGRIMERDPGPAFPVRFYKDAFKIGDKFEPVTRLAEIIKKRGRPEPDASRVLRAANEVGLRGRFPLAEQLAYSFLPENLKYSANIIRANAATRDGDRRLWLQRVNEYLSKTGVAPLTLGSGENLFDQLGAAAEDRTVDGSLISVLMPAFNAERTLQMAVRSLLNQTWTNLEIIIVDDCSTDQTWPIMQNLAESDPRVRIYRNALNAGPYVSKNVAATQARGEWITGHDADDWAHPERLERQIAFTSRLGAPASLSGMLRMASNGSFVRLNKIGGFVHDGACRSALISLMIKTQYFRDLLGSWDTVRVGGDSELLRRIERIEGKAVPQLSEVTMLCFDNPDGLTNDATLGYSESHGVSPYRARYRESFSAAHLLISATSSRIPFPSHSRTFDAPHEMLNEPSVISRLVNAYQANGVKLSQTIEADVLLVTNLCFSGGNASSTIDEITYLIKKGLKVSLIHCPVDSSLGKDISDRFYPWKDIIVNWTQVSKASAAVIICRHPRVLTSMSFRQLSEKLESEYCFVVKNNSSFRPNGKAVYDMSEALYAARRIRTSHLSFCPISGLMREELNLFRSTTGEEFIIEDFDWSPTFDVSLYEKRPNANFRPPFKIGRHGRDGSEKWHEDREQLLQAYPSGPEFEVVILGGADNAKKVLGHLPENWTVFEFGSIEPGNYLKRLDAFIYFPHSRLTEAFGRTVVEAMLAAVPAILPKDFQQTFGELAIYCDPKDVEDVVKRIAASDAANRINFLFEVQRIAAARFSSRAVSNRLSRTKLNLSEDLSNQIELSCAAKEFRQYAMHGTR